MTTKNECLSAFARVARCGALAAGVFGLAGAAQAQTTYNFSQEFGALGSVMGQFSGTDIDGNGELNASEVTVQSMIFSGGLGSLTYSSVDVMSFQWVISDTGGITNPSSGFDMFGRDNGAGIAMNWVAGDYAGLDSTVSSGFLYLSDAATSVPTGTFEATGLTMVSEGPIAPVPEPESYLMMAIGLAGIFVAKRNKRI